jgi:uncharacterized membrane protein
MWTERSSLTRAGNLGIGFMVAAIAAGAAYLLDPRSGGRRRALLRDQLTHRTHQMQRFVGKAGRDARHRARGTFAASRSWLHRTAPDDRVVEERVRAHLGRLSAHPGAIEVSSSDGYVRLGGHILEQELAKVLVGLERVPGVRRVINEMHVHLEAGRISSLQGTGHWRSRPRFEYLQESWSPAPRVIAGVAGTTLIVGGASARSIPSGVIALGGAALVARSIWNVPLSRLFGFRAKPEEGVLVQKTIDVRADPEEVYRRWRDLESLPRFMSHVRGVQRLDESRYRWTVEGPAGVPVEWESAITADVPNELIAWRTVADSPVQSTGVVQFEPAPRGGTRVHIRMRYRPPANLAGHTVAKVFGRDPKRQIDADLMRFKSFVETGRARDYERSAGALRH